jgi:hypothetical protein
VLFDTLIKECSEEEVVAVLAHGELTGTVALSMSVVYILSITLGLCPACSRTIAVQEQDASLCGLLRLGGWVGQCCSRRTQQLLGLLQCSVPVTLQLDW